MKISMDIAIDEGACFQNEAHIDEELIAAQGPEYRIPFIANSAAHLAEEAIEEKLKEINNG